jgi:hypothetical protein
MPTYAELTTQINAFLPTVVAACAGTLSSSANCGTKSSQLAVMRDNQRKAQEAEYNAEALRMATTAAGLQPGQAIPDRFAVPMVMSFENLLTPEARAAAVARADAMRQRLSDNIATARLEVERAKASVNVGAGRVPGLASCRDGWHEWGLVCRKGPRCEGDPSKPLWDSGHQRCYAEEWEGRYNNPTCPSHEDKIDGLCYTKCPASHPHHIEGMPYLCAHSTHAHDAIKDQATYDFISKDDTEAALACAEATLAKDRGRIEEKCGFDAKAKWKAIGEKMATGLVSFATMGITDIMGAANDKLDANRWMFGHENRGGEGGAAEQHIDGVIKAIIDLKKISTEEACVKSIDERDMIGYMKYCPLYKPKPKPWLPLKDLSGANILDEAGNIIYDEVEPIVPQPIDAGSQEDWIPAGEFPAWNVPEVPNFDESRLPVYPPELLAAIPPEFFPDEEKPDMVPKYYPIDLIINPTDPMATADVPAGVKRPWNVLEHPNVAMAFGLAAILILAA